MDDVECLDQMDRKTKVYCCSITSVIVVATALVAVSFGTVEPTEYGILYNTISKQIDKENIYEGGLQYVGLFNSLITFPSIHKTIEFSDDKAAQSKPLRTRTQEGLELALHFAF